MEILLFVLKRLQKMQFWELFFFRFAPEDFGVEIFLDTILVKFEATAAVERAKNEEADLEVSGAAQTYCEGAGDFCGGGIYCAWCGGKGWLNIWTNADSNAEV